MSNQISNKGIADIIRKISHGLSRRHATHLWVAADILEITPDQHNSEIAEIKRQNEILKKSVLMLSKISNWPMYIDFDNDESLIEEAINIAESGE